MKLFQQLLVAPAALGLLAPVAANAAELNIKGMSGYAASAVSGYGTSADQVTSVTQFSDVYPTDWAYQALSNLVERYGCVAGYPNGTFRGNRAMTRYEAAALLNACLDRITEVTDELKRLMKEFERELAILKGRVDGLEARVGELEATQFSTTTKLSGTTTFVIGASSFGGDAKFRGQFGRSVERDNPADASDTNGPVGPFKKMANTANEKLGGTTFNYDQKINLLTSFTGKDLLKARLRAGNFGPSAFGFGATSGIYSPLGDDYVTASGLEVAGETANSITLDRLFYQFPLGSDFTVTAGGLVRQDDMLAVWPSAYPTDTILDFFTYAGAPGAYNLVTGSGAGIWWQKSGWSISANYVASNGNNANPTAATTYNRQFEDGKNFYSVDRSCENAGGIATDCSAATGTVQIAYTADQWGVAAAYNYSSQANGNMNQATATPLASAVGGLGNTNSVGLSAYWSPEESGWIPSVSGGWGLNTTTGADYNSGYTDDANGNKVNKGSAASTLFGYEFDSATTQSWYVGLQWSDVFLKGNSAGMAVGQQGFVTALDLSGKRDQTLGQGLGKDASAAEKRLVRDGQYAMEFWYMFQVTDNISVTPAVFYLSRPLGAATQGETFNQFGGLVKTTFNF